MPPEHRDEGLQATWRIKTRWPDIGVMVLSHHAQRGIAVDLVRDYATGIGYLLKQRVADVEQFTEDLRAVAAGRTVIDPQVVSLLMSGAPVSASHDLTARQERVLGLMARGYSNAAIAQELSLSEKSVVHHVSHIYDVLGLPLTSETHRRVRAVVMHLGSESSAD
jgi:DNA-binding NarL/FixJ family response regulator